MGVAAGVKGRGNKERLSGGEAGRKRCSPRTLLPPGRPAVLQQIGADSSERDASSYLSVSLTLSVFHHHRVTPTPTPHPTPTANSSTFIRIPLAAFCGVTSTFTAFPSAASETWGGTSAVVCRQELATKAGLVHVGEGRCSRQDPVQLDAVITS